MLHLANLSQVNRLAFGALSGQAEGELWPEKESSALKVAVAQNYKKSPKGLNLSQHKGTFPIERPPSRGSLKRIALNIEMQRKNNTVQKETDYEIDNEIDSSTKRQVDRQTNRLIDRAKQAVDLAVEIATFHWV